MKQKYARAAALLSGILFSMASFAQINTFPWTEDFESSNTCVASCASTCLNPGAFTNPGVRDWIVDVSGTTSGSTGPTANGGADHNPGIAGGKYVYAETSSPCTSSPAGTWLLESPAFDFSNTNGGYELEFWYHDYGTSMGTAILEVDDGNGWTQVGPNMGGSNQDQWQQFTANLTSYAGSNNVKFRISYGGNTSFGGDFALDDFTVRLLLADDAGVSQLLSPQNPFCGSDTQMVVEITNFGTNTMTSVNIHHEVNGSAGTTFNWTGSLASGATDTVTITTSPITPGTSVSVWTSMPNNTIDLGPANDSVNTSFFAGMNGVYSIPNDFADFQEAVDELHALGVCDTVWIQVAPGNYNEQIEINEIFGASATSPVYFEGTTGNPANVRLEFDCSSNFSNDGVIMFDGASWVTFRDMTIDNLANSTSWGRVVNIFNSDHLSFDNTIIDGSSVGTTSTNNVVVDAYNTPWSYLSFTDSRIVGGSYSFRLYGNSANHNKGVTIHNCELDSFYYFGVYSYYNDSITITHNKITTDWSYTSSRGIFLLDNDMQVDITHNQVYNNPNTGGNMYYALYLSNCDGTLSNHIRIANNCMTSGNPNYTGFSYAFYLVNSGIMDVVNNTFTWITAPNATSGYMHYISGGGLITEKNNSFITTGSQYARYVTSGYALIESDHNNFYTNGANVHYLNGAFSSTEDFANATGFDANSVEVTADFTDTLACTTCNDTLDGGGTPVAWVMDDLNGETRSNETPDIGAIEFIAAGSFSLGPDSTYCADQLLLEAGPAQSVSWNVNGNNSSNPTYTLDNNTGEPQTYTVAVNIVTNGCGPASDNLTVTLVPSANLDDSLHICADASTTLEPGGGNNATYMWNTGDMTPTIDVSEAGTYSVTKMEEGCESMAEVVVTKSQAVSVVDLEECAENLPVTVDATINDGVNYAWSGGSSVSTASNTFNDQDQYSITVTDAFGCVSSDTFNLTVLEEPQAAIGHNNAGFAYFFDASSSIYLTPNSSVIWDFGNGQTGMGIMDTVVYPFTAAGTPVTYNVTLTIDNGCGEDIAELNLAIDPLTVSELNNGESVSVFPNPATDVLNIQKDGNWENATIELIDLSGRTLQSMQILDGTDLITINLDNVASGSYLLSIKQNESITTMPVIVK